MREGKVFLTGWVAALLAVCWGAGGVNVGRLSGFPSVARTGAILHWWGNARQRYRRRPTARRWALHEHNAFYGVKDERDAGTIHLKFRGERKRRKIWPRILIREAALVGEEPANLWVDLQGCSVDTPSYPSACRRRGGI
ncbi:hypothetical protein DFH07DRAFT_290701 [Mycena maculata]|uniref:Uncharacterized protein n=1 Tax=Mycena maculata TaxID=230809 RepID=A0AAD7NP04_9AGAR|nr:hypothetical protein DFH07DRAFT_290701 [Mycena maculata]